MNLLGEVKVWCGTHLDGCDSTREDIGLIRHQNAQHSYLLSAFPTIDNAQSRRALLQDIRAQAQHEFDEGPDRLPKPKLEYYAIADALCCKGIAILVSYIHSNIQPVTITFEDVEVIKELSMTCSYRSRARCEMGDFRKAELDAGAAIRFSNTCELKCRGACLAHCIQAQWSYGMVEMARGDFGLAREWFRHVKELATSGRISEQHTFQYGTTDHPNYEFPDVKCTKKMYEALNTSLKTHPLHLSGVEGSLTATWMIRSEAKEKLVHCELREKYSDATDWEKREIFEKIGQEIECYGADFHWGPEKHCHAHARLLLEWEAKR